MVRFTLETVLVPLLKMAVAEDSSAHAIFAALSIYESTCE